MDAVQSPISTQDFRGYNDISNYSSNQHFCRLCKQPVSGHDCDEDGYTDCCSSPAISKKDASQAAIYADIIEFLQQQHPGEDFDVMPINGRSLYRFFNLNETFSIEIDLSDELFSIIHKINS